MITDYADNLQRLAQIIATMDTPASGDIEVIPLRYAVASDIQPLLQRLTDGGTAPIVPGAQNTGTAAPSILVDNRSNALIVRSANPTKMAGGKALLAKLDVPSRARRERNTGVHMKNADATKLAQGLRGLKRRPGAGSGASAMRARAAAIPPRRRHRQAARQRPAPSAAGGPSTAASSRQTSRPFASHHRLRALYRQVAA